MLMQVQQMIPSARESKARGESTVSIKPRAREMTARGKEWRECPGHKHHSMTPGIPSAFGVQLASADLTGSPNVLPAALSPSAPLRPSYPAVRHHRVAQPLTPFQLPALALTLTLSTFHLSLSPASVFISLDAAGTASTMNCPLSMTAAFRFSNMST